MVASSAVDHETLTIVEKEIINLLNRECVRRVSQEPSQKRVCKEVCTKRQCDSKADVLQNIHSVSAFKSCGFARLRLSFGRKADIKAVTTNRA
jgi:hypothetical protein